MGQTVKKTLLLFLLSVQGGGVLAQGFWAPGACWVYEQLHLSPYLDIYMYTGDTMIDGLLAQQCTRRICYLNYVSGGGVDTSCVSDIWGFRDWVSLQGDVVYYKHNVAGGSPWDTLYYLGVPGDRWWPPTTQPMTCGYFGMLEIQDTGHMVIGGENLRTWSLAYLDSAGVSTWGNGQPFGSDTLAIIERIGGLPRKFPHYGYDCYGPMDPSFFRLQHYSDWQVTTGSGITCDIALGAASRSMQTAISLAPNPGAVQFSIIGISASASVEVRDPLGRMVHSQANLPENAPTETSTWEIGTYFVSITSGDGRRQVLRWVKQ